MTLSPLKNPNFRYKRIDYKECEYDPDPEAGPETEGPQQEEDEDEDDFLERRSEWEEATRVVVRPEPGPITGSVYQGGLAHSVQGVDQVVGEHEGICGLPRQVT
ncbi:hypothetical protein H0H92_007042 [Tricholoma furcatifolium]|nr:hypothetical protein H0H92_007042 [Tricholoma furcatifolium]